MFGRKDTPDPRAREAEPRAGAGKVTALETVWTVRVAAEADCDRVAIRKIERDGPVSVITAIGRKRGSDKYVTFEVTGRKQT